MAVSLDLAITAIKSGRKEEGRQLLNLLIQQNPNDEMAWLWMSGVVETPEQRARCLIHVLAINPKNEFARKGLALLGVSVPDSRPVQIPRDSEPIKITKLPPKTAPLPELRAEPVKPEASPQPAPAPVAEAKAGPVDTPPTVSPTQESAADPTPARQPFLIDPQTITSELPFTPVNAPFKAASPSAIQASPGILNIQIEPAAGFDMAVILNEEPKQPEAASPSVGETLPAVLAEGANVSVAENAVVSAPSGAEQASRAEAPAEAVNIASQSPATEPPAATVVEVEFAPPVLPVPIVAEAGQVAPPAAEPEAAPPAPIPAPSPRDPILTDTGKLPALPPSVRAGAVKPPKKRTKSTPEVKTRGGLAAAAAVSGAARPPSKPVSIAGIRSGLAAAEPSSLQTVPMSPDMALPQLYSTGQVMPGGGYPAAQPGLNPSANDPTRATVPLTNPYYGHANATMAMPMPPMPAGQPYPLPAPGLAVHSNATMMMPPMTEAEARARLVTGHVIPTANAAAMPMQNGFGWGGQYMGYPLPPAPALEAEPDEDEEEDSGDINILAVLVFGTLSMTAVGGLGMLILLILFTPTV